MGIISSRTTRAWRQHRCATRGLLLVLTTFLSPVNTMSHAAINEPGQSAPGETQFHFPTVPPQHRHTRELLSNAMRYLAPENRMIDPISGYPFEGWNQDPAKGLYLRSFTQLTAIGQYMELLANIIAGTCDTPFLSRKQALANLAHLVKSLRQDQRDPKLSAGNLLGNFLDLATGKRLGPLAVDIEKHKLQGAFGRDKGEAIWKALQTKGWIIPRSNDLEADIVRSAKYGWDHFDGPLAPFSDNATKQKILDILDQRVVMVVFIDNANLSAAAAKTIGALLSPAIKDQAEIAKLRQELERFLEDQQEGYARLYDAKAGQFNFGRDATKDRHFGWVDLQGKWVTGHVDYLVNEFRGPATFVVTRFGLPLDAIKNLGFKMKPYRMQDAREVYVLAPWEGSAFQALGLELAMTELERRAGASSSRTSWMSRSIIPRAGSFPVFFPSRTAAKAFSTLAASAFPTSRSPPCPGSRTRPRSIPWARPTRLRLRRSSSSWRRAGRSWRSCSPSMGRGRDSRARTRK